MEQTYLPGKIRDRIHDLMKSNKVTQAELNRSLRISLDDLVQEGSLGLFGCIDGYNPDSGNLFLTYAAPAIRNAMIDYIRLQNVSFEAKHLNDIISLDDLAKDEVRSKHNFIADPTRQTPEQIYLAQERIDDIHHALYMIEDREGQYLRYYPSRKMALNAILFTDFLLGLKPLEKPENELNSNIQNSQDIDPQV